MLKIRQLFFLFIFNICSLSSIAQTNLVPNPSFEDTLGCPNGYPDLDGKCKDWITFRITPDYFNNCSNYCGYLNQCGYQQPHSGFAYAGFNMYDVNLPNSSEHIGVQLTSSLTIGTRYFISFFVCNAYNPLVTNLACNKIGTLVTTYSYSDTNGLNSLPNYSTLKTDSIISDTINWVKISGSFIADSAYQYLIIGNFFDDSYIDTVQFPNQFGPYDAYYYLDDVCISTDSLFAENWTNINERTINTDNLNIFPNPAQEELNVISDDIGMCKIDLYNSSDQIIFENEFYKKIKINISKLPSGLYFMRLSNEKNSISKKIIILH